MVRIDPLEVKLLFCLEAELPELRRRLELAQLIGEHPMCGESLNPVVNFAFDNCTRAVIENRIVRLCEALPILNRVSEALLNEPLQSGKGRRRRILDADLDLLDRLRAERIAHKVKMSHLGEPAWDEVRERFGSIYRFLFTVMDKIENQLERLKAAGYRRAADDLDAVVTATPGFDERDVSHLVEAANALFESAAPSNSNTDGAGNRI